MWRVDDRRDMITQSMFRQIKDPKHPLHYLLPPVKVSHSQMVLRPTYLVLLRLRQSLFRSITIDLSKKIAMSMSIRCYTGMWT